MTFEAFLQAFSTQEFVAVAVNAIILVVGSYAVEFWPWFMELAPRRARLFFMVPLSFVLPLLASVLGVALYDWSAAFDVTFWPALVAGASAAFAGTLAHSRKLSD